jgi:Glycosyl hydrolases family 2, TIM barrel domain/Glycosyl hydrolases family 2, sugar binding domain/Glycosyl hydrolases family 2
MGASGKTGRLRVVLGVLLLSAWGLAAETEVLYLSGQGKDDPVPWEFLCTAGRERRMWTSIGVPSNWELEGFGTYNYGHDRDKGTEQGKYRRIFTVPDAWMQKRIFLVFEGVMTDTEVRINGRSAGPKHQGGFYRFKYEITDLIQVGENLLEVDVSKVSSDPSVERAERQADYWVFGGIYRPVYIEAVPKEFIEWVAIDARADGTCRVDAHIGGSQDADAIKLEIIGRTGGLLGAAAVATVERGSDKATIRTQSRGHKPWTAETPNLYTARVSLLKGDEVVHAVSERFGFRTFEVKPGDGLYLNGRKIRLKGVCRHSFWPDSGRCLSREISYDDVRLIKAMNMNAVRMSHYPPDRHFLQACDELGLYVLDELAGWQKPPYSTEIGKKLVKEMVTRDVCHPCILFWDNANEGGWNRALDDQFALYDPQQRTVLHPWENFGGVDTDHYESYASTQRKLSGETLFMPTEFLHGLYDGGHGAGLDDYWNATLASPMGAGGFLWALVDEGLVRMDRDGQIDVSGNQAPDGIVGPYREKEGSFYTIKEIFSPVQIDCQTLPLDFDGRLDVENRYDFTNLNECAFEVKLAMFPGPDHTEDGHRALAEKIIAGPNVPPHETGIIDLGLPGRWRGADALYVTAYDPTGNEIWTWTWDLRDRDYYRGRFAKTESQDDATVSVGGGADQISLRTGDLVMEFSGSTGRLAGVILGGRQIGFGGGPRLIGGSAKASKVTLSQNNKSMLLDVLYEGDMDYVRWRLYPTGWVCLEYQYKLTGSFGVLGVDFECPEYKMQRMRWLGRGPYRVWKNRMKGGSLGVWSNEYKKHVPGVTWDFPEFKGYYRDWRWVVFETDATDITMINATDDVFLGVYRPNDGPDPRTTRLDAPETGIALLHGIPAIGTKFQKPEALGPESQKNSVSGTYRGAVWIHFGK